VRSLLTAAEGSRYAPLFALLVNTGLRKGEALALHWSDVDLDEKLLRVRGTLARVDGELIVTETKTPKSRRAVPLSPTRRATIARHPHPAGGRAATCRVHVEADTVRLHDRAR
jgi:integrase